MNIILSSKRHHFVGRASIFLITVALIVGMVGCGGGPYELTISSNEGGTVTTPGEGTFTYDAGTVVNLVATPDAGYRFASWITYGDVETLADASDATTTITMNDDYTIRAGFALEIRDWYDLDAIRNNLSGSYILVNDLDSNTAGYDELASPTANNGTGWQPIGTYSESFMGSFYGEGYEIRYLFINRPDEKRVGLFGRLSGGAIFDVGVVNAKVTGKDSVGGLAGTNSGYVQKSYSTGNVTGNYSVGGLVGFSGGTVSDSYSTSNVFGDEQVGGLVGENYGTVSNSYSTGNVTGNKWVGGLVGDSASVVGDGIVSNSYSTGSVIGNYSVGGLVGFNWYGTVSNSYSTGNVAGNEYAGGLVGANWEGSVSNSYSTGSVTGNEYAGGLVGENFDGTVSNSFWDTQTSGQATSGGGTGKTTVEMHDIDTFTDTETEGLDEPWDIIAVANPGIRNPSYIWNIVDDATYPFLSWQS